MRSWKILVSCFLYFSITRAWPWPPSIRQPRDALVPRQNDDDPNSSSARSDSTETIVASTAPASASASATASDSDTSTVKSDKPSGSSGSQKTTSPPKTTQNQKTTQAGLPSATSVAQNAPAGGISLISPPAATTTYYKIGQNITFVWNYTSLLVPPKAIDVVISNTQSTYTLTQNASIAPTETLIWDTGKYGGGQQPLINAMYTLDVFDAQLGMTGVPSPGHLGSNGIAAPFGIYSPQAVSTLGYIPACVTCGGAMSLAEKEILKFVFTMFIITLLSFTYFTNGFLLGF